MYILRIRSSQGPGFVLALRRDLSKCIQPLRFRIRELVPATGLFSVVEVLQWRNDSGGLPAEFLSCD